MAGFEVATYGRFWVATEVAMNAKTETYLKTGLGMAAPYIARIDELLTISTTMLGATDDWETFVSEYVNTEGVRVFENAWLWKKQVCMEGNLTGAVSADFTPLIRNVSYLKITSAHYDFKTAKAESRISAQFYFGTATVSSLGGNLKASGQNCDTLRDILITYVCPQIVAG
jgi:hypothetical protein